MWNKPLEEDDDGMSFLFAVPIFFTSKPITYHFKYFSIPIVSKRGFNQIHSKRHTLRQMAYYHFGTDFVSLPALLVCCSGGWW
jgi:hypothetical protein